MTWWRVDINVCIVKFHRVLKTSQWNLEEKWFSFIKGCFFFYRKRMIKNVFLSLKDFKNQKVSPWVGFFRSLHNAVCLSWSILNSFSPLWQSKINNCYLYIKILPGDMRIFKDRPRRFHIHWGLFGYIFILGTWVGSCTISRAKKVF